MNPRLCWSFYQIPRENLGRRGNYKVADLLLGTKYLSIYKCFFSISLYSFEIKCLRHRIFKKNCYLSIKQPIIYRFVYLSNLISSENLKDCDDFLGNLLNHLNFLPTVFKVSVTSQKEWIL